MTTETRKPLVFTPGMASGLAAGAVVGMLDWAVGADLNLLTLIPYLPDVASLLASMGLGAVLAATRLRWLLWGFSGFLCGLYLVIAFTPVIVAPVESLIREDPLQKSDAIVVLSSGAFHDGSLDASGQDRVLEALALYRAGWGRRLVITRIPVPRLSSRPGVEHLLHSLGLSPPLDEVGPVSSTRDEAVAIERLARQRGWRRVIVVTGSLHTRRAQAVFLKAGVPALIHPSHESLYDLSDLSSIFDRIDAFKDWLHEIAAWEDYRVRGWV